MRIGRKNLLSTNYMIEEFKQIKSTYKDLQNFGILVGGVFLCIGLLMWWKERGYFVLSITLASLLILFGIFYPRILKPLQKVWMALALVLGLVMTRIILVIFFYFCITPFALLARLFGKRFLDMPLDDRSSYWIERTDVQDDPKKMENQF